MRRISTLLFVLILLFSGCAPISNDIGYRVVTHPDGRLYTGDVVSFEIFAPEGEGTGRTVSVTFEGSLLGSVPFIPYGIGQRNQATLWWVWETEGLEAGKYEVIFTLENGETWTELIRLLPANRVPPPEPEAVWESLSIECCMIWTISGTDAARDIAMLSEMADQESAEAASQLGVSKQEQIQLIFMPRVIGHGGFAWDGVYISYLDGNYVGNEMELVLHHEFVHHFDNWIGGEYMPSILQEGLAVYLSGGHFKPEPIMDRAAALVDLGWYIPLAPLADDFYNQQHDISYLEAAAFIEYLFASHGPAAFYEFYRTIPYAEDLSGSEILDRALQENYHISLAEAEAAFLAQLEALTVTEEVRSDLELTVAYYDAVRRYQTLFDPSAYFLTAWLPNGTVMRERGIVADLTRHPTGWENMLLEKLLIRLHNELFSGDYRAAERSAALTTWVLDLFDQE